MLKSADIQDKINAIDTQIQAGAPQGQIDRLNDQKADLEKQLTAALTDEAQLQNLQDRVEEAKKNGYLLDTLTASNGMTMAELSYSPENHELVCIAVQKAFLSQQDAFNNKVTNLENEIKLLNNDLAIAKDQEETDGIVIQQVELENTDLTKKLKNATDIIAEYETEIKQQAQKISALLEQQTAAAIPVAQLSAEELENNLINEINGKQIKVYNVRPKDENAVTNIMFIANNAITGAEFEDYYLYLCKIDEDKPKRYKEIKEADAMQLRADFENKKAEINANIPSLIQPELTPLVMPEISASTEVHPTTPEENTNTDVHSGGTQTAEGNTTVHELVQQAETPTVTYATKEEHEALAARVATIERHANIQAVA